MNALTNETDADAPPDLEASDRERRLSRRGLAAAALILLIHASARDCRARDLAAEVEVDADAGVVSDPASLAMMGLGLGGVGLAARLRRARGR